MYCGLLLGILSRQSHPAYMSDFNRHTCRYVYMYIYACMQIYCNCKLQTTHLQFSMQYMQHAWTTWTLWTPYAIWDRPISNGRIVKSLAGTLWRENVPRNWTLRILRDLLLHSRVTVHKITDCTVLQNIHFHTFTYIYIYVDVINYYACMFYIYLHMHAANMRVSIQSNMQSTMTYTSSNSPYANCKVGNVSPSCNLYKSENNTKWNEFKYHV